MPVVRPVHEQNHRDDDEGPDQRLDEEQASERVPGEVGADEQQDQQQERAHEPAATALPLSTDGYGRLVVREGKNATYEVELRQPVTVIGRAADAGVRLADQAVSRHHAEIRVSDDGASVADPFSNR